MKNNSCYVTGDVHGHIDINKFNSKNFPEGKNLDKSDVILVCGDLGLVWDVFKSKTQEQHWIDWITNKPWTTVFVDGNHENHDRLNKLLRINMFGGEVGKVSESIFHLRRGNIYTINNKTFFCMGGAKSIDKAYRQPFISWWPEEEPSFEELERGLVNLEKNNWIVDFIIGHTGPTYAIKRLGEICKCSFGDKLENLNQYFEEVCRKVKFKKMFFGHFHVDENVDGKFHCLYSDIIQIK